jgi:DNA-directed RNA polymerase omega subunit
MAVMKDPPDSQFAYVVLVAKRARQLMAGGRPLIDNPKNLKYTRVAEEELQKGMLEYELPDTGDGSGENPGKK